MVDKLSENILDKFSMDFLRNQVLKNAYGNNDTLVAAMDPRILIVWYLFFGLVPWFVNSLPFLLGCFVLVTITTALAHVAGQTRAKGKTDFVTAVDTRVQENIRAVLEQLTPGTALMAEEKDNDAVDLDSAIWLLDPVDGTTNLIHGFRHSAISLALAVEGRVELGLIYDPYADEMFTAQRGKGAFCNGEAIHVGGAAALADSLCSVGTNPGCRDQADAAFARMRRIYDRCHDVRRVGAASIELCYVACGRLDAYLEHGLKPWDYAAGMLVVAEAGGRVTDFAGNVPLLDASRCAILATNGQIHSELQSLL